MGPGRGPGSRAVARGVVGPLRRAVEVLRAVAGSDLTRKLEVAGSDEVDLITALSNPTWETKRLLDGGQSLA